MRLQRPRSDGGKDERDVHISKKARGEKDVAMEQKLCPHNKAKATCIECAGCPHGKRRQNCKDCNAGSRQWCMHGKRRHDCGDCSGCPHGKIKRYVCPRLSKILRKQTGQLKIPT